MRVVAENDKVDTGNRRGHQRIERDSAQSHRNFQTCASSPAAANGTQIAASPTGSASSDWKRAVSNFRQPLICHSKKDGEKKDNETDSGEDPTPVDMAIFENLNVSSSRPIVGVLHKLERQARDQNRRVERRGRSDLNNYT